MHTPGPWNLIAESVEDTDGNSIAMVTGGSGCQYIEDDVNAECLANARLIAAAPALLDALETLTVAMYDDVLFEDAITKARAAIAAARGEGETA